MSKLFPKIALQNVTEITRDMLEQHNIKGLIIDIDNTLTHHNSPTIEPEVTQWVEYMREYYPIILLSNNHIDRVKPFAEMLQLDYIASGGKPLPSKGLTTASQELNLPFENLAMIGDQIFTDVLGGNLAGALSIRVEPIQTEGGWFFNIKRLLENFIMKRYYKHKGR